MRRDNNSLRINRALLRIKWRDPCRALHEMHIGGWLIVGVGALLGAIVVTHPAIAVVAIAATLALLHRRLSVWARLVALLVVVGSGYRAQRAMAAYEQERASVRRVLGAHERCAGQGEVVASPVYRGGKFVIVVRSHGLDCGEATVEGNHLIRIFGGPDGLLRGDNVEFVAQLGPVTQLQQMELGNPLPRLAATGVVLSGGALFVERIKSTTGLAAAIDRARAQVRRRILASYAPKAEALGRALVLGENDLEPDEQLAFQKSGLAHLLAVSGTHLVLAVVTVVNLIKALLLRFTALAERINVAEIVSPIGVVLALLYADFAGGSGSAWRAALMLSATYAATSLRRRLRGLQALAYSLVLGATIDPLVGYDISFLLSAAATAGLIVIGPILTKPLEGRFWLPIRFLLKGLATTVSAMIPCAPLLLLLSGELSLAGLVANVIAGPVGELLALPLCLIHAIAFPWPWLEAGLALSGSGALLVVGRIAHASSAFELAQVALPPPTAAQFACLLMTTLVVVLGRAPAVASSHGAKAWAKWATFGIGAASYFCLERVAASAGAPTNTLRITTVDVGQGDALLVDLPDGRVMLIDGGGSITGGLDPGLRVLYPLLRARRRKHLDVVILTHPHPDHYGGLVTLLPRVSVGEFWEAGASDDAKQPDELVRLRKGLRDRGVKTQKLSELCGAARHFGAASVEILGPCPDASQAENTNNQSIVTKITFGTKVAILPGDAETEAELALVHRFGSGLRGDFLKLGHHGSRSSSSEEWLRAIQPAVAVVSVGLRNRFGHPHPTTLGRFSDHQIPLYRTDELGAVYWVTDGREVRLQMARSKPVD